MRVPPWKSLGMCQRVTNKGKGGFGKASDRAKAEDHRTQGFPVVVRWGALSVEGQKLDHVRRSLSGSQSLSQAL